MENLSLVANVVLPLFLIMAIGYTLRCVLSLDASWVSLTNKVLFRLLLPMLLFRNMVESDLSGMSSPGMLRLVALCTTGMCVTFALLYWLIPLFVQENSRRGVLIQGVYRSNTALFGIPLALQLYGEGNITITVLLVSCMVPLLNILSIVALEGHRTGKPDGRRILKEIAKNPILIAILLGLVCNVLEVPLPGAVKSAVWGLGNCATPISFLTLGASFTFASAAKNRRALSFAVLARLFVVPLIWVGAAALLGYRGQYLAGMLMVFGPPTAVSSFPMAAAMGGDAQLSSEIVVFTSAFSMLSMFLWIFSLKSTGLI